MKKLFLYTTIFFVIFILSYEVAYTFAKNSPVNNADLINIDQLDHDQIIHDMNTTEHIDPVKVKYLLKTENDYIVVYESSNILFEKTSININTLPSEIQNEINEGIEFEEIEDLYNYLESIST